MSIVDRGGHQSIQWINVGTLPMRLEINQITHTQPQTTTPLTEWCGNGCCAACTLVHHQIICHHIKAEVLIVLSLEQGKNEKWQRRREGAGKEGREQTERTFDRIKMNCISCESSCTARKTCVIVCEGEEGEVR